MFSSAAVTTVSLASMGSFFYLQSLWGEEEASASLGWLPLLSLIVFFAGYSGGMASVPFIIMGELFPSQYRSVLGAVSSSFSLLCTFIVIRSFPVMQMTLGSSGTFFLFTCCTALSIAFVFFFLPETKGRTLEDIGRIFTEKVANVDVSKNDAKQKVNEEHFLESS